jgi:hypothetical protein
MENQIKERSNWIKQSATQPKAEQKTAPVRQQWEEQEILALQEKARHHQRRYPAGGYQGL